MYIGDKKIIDIRLGEQRIKRIYKGNKIIYNYEQAQLPDNALFDSEGCLLLDSEGFILQSNN